MSVEDRTLIFEPYLEKEFSVYVSNSEHIEAIMYPGELSQYATLIDSDPYGPPREIRMRLSLPESLTPGTYTVQFGGKEYYNVGGTVGGLAAVASRVTVLSLYDGFYPKFSIAASDMGIGEQMNITVTIENFGTQDIAGAYANIDIYDPNDNLVTTLKTNNAPVPSKKNSLQPAIVQATFDSSKFDLLPGFYKAVATLSYDGQTFPDKSAATFRLGTLTVTVTDWTRVIYANVTNKFLVTISSDWAGRIDDVYARISTPDGILKTPNLDVDKFQTTQLEAYWEVKKTELGNQTINIELFYAGTSVTKQVVVEVVPPIGPGVEKPSSISISPMTIGIIVLVLLIAINIYFFVFRKNDKNENNHYNNPPNSGVQPPRI
jgi:hypothetical protein